MPDTELIDGSWPAFFHTLDRPVETTTGRTVPDEALRTVVQRVTAVLGRPP